MEQHNGPVTDQDHYIGIDVGTGSARACIIDSNGNIRSLTVEPIGLWQPEAGYYEQSTTNIWSSICICVKRALCQNDVDPNSIKGIGFDATCSLAVFKHGTDQPVPITGEKFTNDGNDRNVILWLDHRSVKETEIINSTKHNVLRYVGGSMSIEMEIPKILWLKNNMPTDLFSSCSFFDLVDALTFLATNNTARSFCSTVCKQGLMPIGVDGSTTGWQEDFFETIGLGELCEGNFEKIGGIDGKSGRFLTAGEPVGGLSEKASKQLGLPAGIPVGSGVIDAYAGWIGTVGALVDLGSSQISEQTDQHGSPNPFRCLAVVAGTSSCHLAMSRDPIFVDGVWGPYRDVILPKCWISEGGQSATGELLRHVLETHPAYQDTISLANLSDISIYDYLNSYLGKLAEKKSAPGISYLARHLFFYGDLWGNRSPLADPNMTGSVIGLTSDISITGLALQYYGAMEFIALQTRHIIDTMNKAGHSIQSIFMSGSQCQNGILMQLIATACNMPVVIPQYVNAAVVHGAAMLGAKAGKAHKTGGKESLWNIMGQMSKAGRVELPSTSKREKKLLDVKYKVFLEQSRLQREYRKSVDTMLKECELIDGH